MTPQEVLPAIPRQKVKSIKTGKIHEVLGYDIRHGYVIVPDEGYGVERLYVESVEPVHEEPRKLKVGDKVVRVSDDDYGGKAIMYGEVTSKRKDSNGEIFYEVAGWHTSERGIRHCTPQEVADHFA